MGKEKKGSIVKLVIVFVVGCAIGAIFYPSKTIIKKVEVESVKDKETIAELEKRVSSLTNTNRKLSEKTHTIIVERPDGSKKTEIIKVTDEYETKTQEIKEKYEKKLAVQQIEIQKLKEYNKTEINKKRFGIEAGVLASRSYYIHMNADLFGPIFLGIQTQLGSINTLGAGIGIRL